MTRDIIVVYEWTNIELQHDFEHNVDHKLEGCARDKLCLNGLVYVVRIKKVYDAYSFKTTQKWLFF